MKTSLYIEILDLQYDRGLNQKVDITKLINRTFPLNKNYDLLSRKDQIKYYLDQIEKDGYLNYDFNFFKENYQEIEDADLVIKATITTFGYNFLNGLKRDKSTIETNESIKINTSHQTLILLGTLLISIISLGISILNFVSKPQPQTLLLPKELINKIETITPSQKNEIPYIKSGKENFKKKS